MLGIGTPGNSYYIFKWQDYYLFPEIRYVQNKENDVVNNIGYYSVFLDKVFIPENLKLYENNILEELKDALNVYGEMGMRSSPCRYVYNFNF